MRQFLLAGILCGISPAYAEAYCEDGHWVSKNIERGEMIKLEDGLLWKTDPGYRIDAMLWLNTESITICDDEQLINTDTGERVYARRVGSGNRRVTPSQSIVKSPATSIGTPLPQPAPSYSGANSNASQSNSFATTSVEEQPATAIQTALYSECSSQNVNPAYTRATCYISARSVEQKLIRHGWDGDVQMLSIAAKCLRSMIGGTLEDGAGYAVPAMATSCVEGAMISANRYGK